MLVKASSRLQDVYIDQAEYREKTYKQRTKETYCTRSHQDIPHYNHQHGQRRYRHGLPGEYSGSRARSTLTRKSLLDIKPQEQNLPGTDTRMDPLAEFTKLECWDDNGKPYLKEVSIAQEGC